MHDQNIAYEEQPVHFGHFGAIALCAMALIGITVMRNGFSLQPQADASPQLLSYEQIYAQSAGSTEGDTATALADAEEKTEVELAAIDPTRRPQVAGASTADMATEDIFSAEGIAAIQINLQTVPTTAEAIQAYAADMADFEVRYNTLGLMEAVNSDNQNVLQKTPAGAAAILVAMQKISVPRGVEYYHKHQMLLYRTLGEMADILAGNKSSDVMPVYSGQLVQLMQKLDDMRQEIIVKHGVTL